MYQTVIEFWFEEIERTKWFAKDDDFDELIRSKFSKVHAQATRCELFEWRISALGCLAEIIVLDQFSRNLFRGNALSFAFDALALSLAQSAIARGLDLELTVEQRSFLYMPFMHSESLMIHEQAMVLFSSLNSDTNLKFEIRHKDIIERFGRYPHRNAVLGRESNDEERQFLTQAGSSF
jgi:uncharacterized protein (DUF924 family)